MSRIAHDFFAASPVLSYPILAMLLFAGVFALVTYKTFRASDDEMNRRAALPLEENRHD